MVLSMFCMIMNFWYVCELNQGLLQIGSNKNKESHSPGERGTFLGINGGQKFQSEDESHLELYTPKEVN